MSYPPPHSDLTRLAHGVRMMLPYGTGSALQRFKRVDERRPLGRDVIRPTMPSADTPTQLERDLSYIISFFLPPLGILLAVVHYLKYPPGFRTLARNCILISIVVMVAYTLVELLLDFTIW